MVKRQQFLCPLRTATLSLKFENMVPEGWILFLQCYICHNCTAVRAGTSTSHAIFLLLVRAARKKRMLQYCMIGSVVFVFFFCGHSTQTDCGSGSVDPKVHHRARRSLTVCEHTGGVLRDLAMAFHRNIFRDHSLIGRRNYLMT